MHISLDSALGQQRRLNQVGESITQIAPNPAAAYSLRSLTGGDPKVVRVRRESDNHEQDFTASEVSSGALVDFVNSQVTAPLDIREIDDSDSDGNNDGRVGNFLIAKAAYSLRSLGTRQATVTSSGDTDGDTDGKFVCQVRRSSDDKIKSFTADEISDGTLLSFVNEIQTLGTVSNSVGNNDFVLTNASNTGFTATLSSGTGVCGWAFTAKSGDKVTVSFDAVVRSGSPQFIPRRATALSGSNLANTVSNPALAINSSGSYSTEFTYDTDDAGSLTFSEGDAGSDFDISNFQVTVFKGAGHVKTWYDQSVTTQAGDTATGNHATQGTPSKQPKIVSAGSLLADGIDFDGTDDELETAANISGSNISGFVVANLDGTAANSLYSVGDTKPNVLFGNPSLSYVLNGGTALSGGTVSTNTDVLFTQLFISGGTSKTFINGSAIASGDAGSNTASSDKLTIGNLEGIDRFMDGSIEELIIYASDQTDNRTAIEANMGEHYSISGIPAFDNSVNGFVETWYDQSGNGTNAVQATASSQPKIVNAGTLLNELDFDGLDDELDFTALNASDVSIFSVASFDDTAGQDRIISGQGSQSGEGFGKASATRGFFRASGQSARQPVLNATISADQDTLLSFIRASDTGTFFTNGTASDTFTESAAFRAGSIGGAGSKIDGSIKEIIIYASDQTSSRTAIETNMNSHYSIF